MVGSEPMPTGGTAPERPSIEASVGSTDGNSVGTLAGRGRLIRPGLESSGLGATISRAGSGSWLDGLHGVAQAIARSAPVVRLATFGVLGVAVVIGVFAVAAVMRSGAPSRAPTLADLAAPSDRVVAAAAGGTSVERVSSLGAGGAGVGRPEGSAGESLLDTSTIASDLTVHVAGGVREPGLVRLPAGARVADALAAAGGAAGADLDRVNLAERILDGQRIWVPRVGESSVPVPVGLAPTAEAGGSSHRRTDGGAASAGDSDSGPIRLNSADASALEELPGVGPATAAAIISYREEHGPFSSIDDLLEVRGIGPAKLAAMVDRLVL